MERKDRRKALENIHVGMKVPHASMQGSIKQHHSSIAE
jgi:hypothetical protein